MREDRETDEILLARLREGDEEAFGRLFQRHLPALKAWVESHLPPRVLRRVSVSDVLQEVRIVASQKLPAFEPLGDGALRGWLLAIADRKVHESIRRHAGASKRSVGREVTCGGRVDTACHQAEQGTPSEAAMAREEGVRVRGALEALPEDYRTVLSLAHEHHLTLREVAELMGRSREVTKKLYGRAVRTVREALRSVGGTP